MSKVKLINGNIKVFAAFEECKISVDVVASSDVSVSLTLDKKQQDKGDVPLLLVRSLDIAMIIR